MYSFARCELNNGIVSRRALPPIRTNARASSVVVTGNWGHMNCIVSNDGVRAYVCVSGKGKQEKGKMREQMTI